ncbi:MAG TPA: HPF/RaiA family ribosome-associated protein, partial [Angustibacter sp.]|nr:HPF/RaiA family ribosome-associated protein [Angustibacter sp.]
MPRPSRRGRVGYVDEEVIVEIVVTGRHVEVKERFRRHLQEKLAKVPQLAPRIQRLDVVISHEPNKRQTDS